MSTQPGYQAPTVTVAASLPKRRSGAVLIVGVCDDDGTSVVLGGQFLDAEAVRDIETALTALGAKAGIEQSDVASWEINEAFASVTVAAIKALGLDPDTVNVNGSGCSLGHPIGCTGARMIVTMMNELERTNSRYGVVAMCAAGGMGSATVIERV